MNCSTHLDPAIVSERLRRYHPTHSPESVSVLAARTQQPAQRSLPEWRTYLGDRYGVLRLEATEPPFSGLYCHETRSGIYLCGGCGMPLFESQAKYDSGSGWPSFCAPLSEERIQMRTDRTLRMERTEILCARCHSHLGHVFDDGPEPTGLRYCVNSLSLDFREDDAHEHDLG